MTMASRGACQASALVVTSRLGERANVHFDARGGPAQNEHCASRFPNGLGAERGDRVVVGAAIAIEGAACALRIVENEEAAVRRRDDVFGRESAFGEGAILDLNRGGCDGRLKAMKLRCRIGDEEGKCFAVVTQGKRRVSHAWRPESREREGAAVFGDELKRGGGGGETSAQNSAIR